MLEMHQHILCSCHACIKRWNRCMRDMHHILWPHVRFMRAMRVCTKMCTKLRAWKDTFSHGKTLSWYFFGPQGAVCKAVSESRLHDNDGQVAGIRTSWGSNGGRLACCVCMREPTPSHACMHRKCRTYTAWFHIKLMAELRCALLWISKSFMYARMHRQGQVLIGVHVMS